MAYFRIPKISQYLQQLAKRKRLEVAREKPEPDPDDVDGMVIASEDDEALTDDDMSTVFYTSI